MRGFYYKLFCALTRGRVVLFRTPEGFCYELDLSNSIDSNLYLGKFEPEVAYAIEQYCRSGMTVLDIGANIGAHAVRLAYKIGKQGKLYAFEPTDYAYNRLVRNINLNAMMQVETFRMALSNKNAPGEKISCVSRWKTDGNHVPEDCVVDFVRLDDWAETHKVSHIDLIKIDVDGNEYSILEGGRNIIKQSRPLIIIEVWGMNFRNDKNNPFILLQYLGYRFFDMSREREYKTVDELRRQVSSSDGTLLDYSINIICN